MPFSHAQEAVKNLVAFIDNVEQAEILFFFSTAGPTTKGPIPTANSLSLIDANFVAKH